MQIHISRAGKKIGEYSLDETNRLLKEGVVHLNDQAWTPGQSDWGSLSSINGIERANVPPPIPQTQEIATNVENQVSSLKTVASKQRIVFYIIGAQIVNFLLMPGVNQIVSGAGTFLAVLLLVMSVVYIYQLSTALRMKWPALWCLGSVMPFFGLLVLLVVTNRATKVLKENGISVGFMGVPGKDLEKLK